MFAKYLHVCQVSTCLPSILGDSYAPSTPWVKETSKPKDIGSGHI